MNKIILYSLMLVAALTAASCRHHGEEPSPQPKEKAERTVIVYMAAENSLSKFSRSDSLEMVQGLAHVGEKQNLILYKDDDRLPVIYRMSQHDGVVRWRSYAKEHTSTDSTTMLATFREIIDEYPAHHYGLVLWSHASGWVPFMENANVMSDEEKTSTRRRTFGVDNNQNSSSSNAGTEMEITALRWVLEQLPHLDYILFDCCFMQNVEVAYELRKVADYLIGSPAEIPGNGAPYAHIMDAMMKGDAMEIAEQYYQFYRTTNGVALSVIDCLELDALASQTASCLQAIYSGGQEPSLDGVHNYVPFEKGYKWRPNAYDMKSFMHCNLQDELYQPWLAQFNRTVPFQKATSYWDSIFYGSHNHLDDIANYSGLSMFLPEAVYERLTYNWNLYFMNTSWYRAAGWDRVAR
ncbi:MAG: hypothetical protein IJR87_05385 [Bacteroidaceae bacterium]|nr:hypothetical protein [Bacteroidaceae bacterium]